MDVCDAQLPQELWDHILSLCGIILSPYYKCVDTHKLLTILPHPPLTTSEIDHILTIAAPHHVAGLARSYYQDPHHMLIAVQRCCPDDIPYLCHNMPLAPLVRHIAIIRCSSNRLDQLVPHMGKDNTLQEGLIVLRRNRTDTMSIMTHLQNRPEILRKIALWQITAGELPSFVAQLPSLTVTEYNILIQRKYYCFVARAAHYTELTDHEYRKILLWTAPNMILTALGRFRVCSPAIVTLAIRLAAVHDLYRLSQFATTIEQTTLIARRLGCDISHYDIDSWQYQPSHTYHSEWHKIVALAHCSPDLVYMAVNIIQPITPWEREMAIMRCAPREIECLVAKLGALTANEQQLAMHTTNGRKFTILHATDLNTIEELGNLTVDERGLLFAKLTPATVVDVFNWLVSTQYLLPTVWERLIIITLYPQNMLVTLLRRFVSINKTEFDVFFDRLPCEHLINLIPYTHDSNHHDAIYEIALSNEPVSFETYRQIPAQYRHHVLTYNFPITDLIKLTDLTYTERMLILNTISPRTIPHVLDQLQTQCIENEPILAISRCPPDIVHILTHTSANQTHRMWSLICCSNKYAWIKHHTNITHLEFKLALHTCNLAHVSKVYNKCPKTRPFAKIRAQRQF